MTNQIDTGTDELLCSLDERVALITLNRPERKNALSDNLTPALRQTLFELNTNQEAVSYTHLTLPTNREV